MVSSLKDPNISMLLDNISATFEHLNASENRSLFFVWFVIFWNIINLSALVFITSLRESYLFTIYCNIAILVSVATYKSHGQNKVTMRYLSLANNALWPCFLQAKFIGGGRVSIRSLVSKENDELSR